MVGDVAAAVVVVVVGGGGWDPDELPCRPDELPPPSARDDDDEEDFSPPPGPDLDFLEPPPNSRLKKPGLLSPLLDMLGHVTDSSTSGHVIKSEASMGHRSSSASVL